MRPFLNPLNLGGRKKRAQDVFAATPYTSVAASQGRLIAIPFVPSLSIQAHRTATSGLTRPVLDIARPGFHLQTHTADAQVNNPAILDGVNLAFRQALVAAGSAIAWNYAEAPKFCKVLVVQKVGAVALDVDLSSLGVVGEVRAKNMDTSNGWDVWARGVVLNTGTQANLVLNSTAAASGSGPLTVSGTTLTLAASMAAGRYAIHAFAHDDGSDGLIKCGFYQGNGSANGPDVALGWRPQFVEIKAITPFSSGWYIFDSARGMIVNGFDAIIAESDTGAETNNTDFIDFTPTGFKLKSTNTVLNGASTTYAYRAIREPT